MLVRAKADLERNGRPWRQEDLHSAPGRGHVEEDEGLAPHSGKEAGHIAEDDQGISCLQAELRALLGPVQYSLTKQKN